MPSSAVNPVFVRLAHSLADRAGDVILPHFRGAGEVTNKAGESFDPVTEADRGAEAAMRRLIESECPDHGISGEELPERAAQSPFRWVLDPIDGTKAFIMGLPTWGTLIGLTQDGRPLFGMMDQPYLGERFWGAEGGAHFRNRHGEHRIRSRPCASLSEAVLAATTPDMFKGEEAARFQRLSAACRMTRFGGDCYLYCMLAMGFVDIVVESGLKPFDIVPLVPIIEAAGGVVTSWDGADPCNGGRILAVGDPALHEVAMNALAGNVQG
jgi:histidinol phosphatase-like enzyme (inositol monophosphatase family)